VRGAGVCQFATFIVEDDVKAGRLINVLPDWTPRTSVIHAALPSRRGLLASVRALLDFLARKHTTIE
jgi:DNA-binding transcriptional LysR family regulator